jgi:DNA-binding NtrC family response regulator
MTFNDALHTVTGTRATQLRRPKLRLQVVAGADTGKRLEFEESARIGSRTLADLVLRDPKVSGLHCEIQTGAELRVRDLGSKNGTYIGNLRIVEAVVPIGEILTIGDSRVRMLDTSESVQVPLSEANDYYGLVGVSSAMRALTARLARLESSDTTVLIQGETGTGKELVAQALHLHGPRAAEALVVVDCGSLQPNLIESELFGHERGAFTGADRRVHGAFERAHRGTLFLDEIGELPLDLQPKLLRALEARHVRRVGGSEFIPFDVRVVAATHRDLGLEVTRGRFREDLYYRLSVVRLTVPPLRERLEDVPLLAVSLLRQMGADPASCLTVETLDMLTHYDWPGNVRELRNTLERAVALMEPVVVRETSRSHIDAVQPAGVDVRIPLRVGKQRVIEAYERAYVTALLAECQGNVSEVARRAGMDRMSIHRLIQRLRLRDD